jgi:glycine/D-amino acid oxidase-like deaminating enzyme
MQAESFWMATAPGPAYEPLADSQTFDVAVVGAGISGLTAALLLKRGGARVAVIEADRVAAATTGYTTGKLTSLHGLVYAGLVQSHGEERARTYGEANEAAIDMVEEIAREERIECDFERMAAVTYTEKAGEVAKVEDEVQAAQQLGLPASFTTETDLPFDVAAAISFERQARFHPRRYCLGLAAAIEGDGSRVFEQSRVVDFEADGRGWTVKTASGNVRADHAVFATQLPFFLRGLLFAKTHPVRSHVVTIRTPHLPRAMYITASKPTRSIRPHPAPGGEVVLVGGEGHRPGAGSDKKRYETLRRYAQDRFDATAFEYQWSAHDYHPADGLPYAGRLGDDGPFVVTGLKGWGLSQSTAAAMAIAGSIQGQELPWTDLYDPNRLGLPRSAWPLLRDGLLSANQLTVEGLRHRGVPRCTHMGCVLAWNDAEETWDCPCHGSRFGADGSVLRGPATRPLDLDG